MLQMTKKGMKHSLT